MDIPEMARRGDKEISIQVESMIQKDKFIF
jgi:hypothetical protein